MLNSRSGRQDSSETTTPKRPGSKMAQHGQSLNHLLNFTLPPRQSQVPQSLPRRSRKNAPSHQVWNKERFVNAQYRFVMNPNGDFTVHFADPDIFFQWQDILQVIIPRSSALATAAASGAQSGQDEGHTTCPICLSPPVAPRMTKCGHVFCFPCILHYLNTSDSLKWIRCPICFDSVNEKQLKCVKWYDGPDHSEDDIDEAQPEASSSASALDAFATAPREGSTMRMRLMQRPQITTLALPRSPTWPSDLIPPHQAPFHFLPDVYNFAKFMLATPTYLITDLTRDLDELAGERRALAGMGDELGVSFVDAADAKLRHQIAKAAALESAPLREAVEKALRDQAEIEERVRRQAQRKREEMQAHQPSDVPDEYLALQSHALNDNAPQPPQLAAANSQAPNRNPRQRRNVNPPPPSTQTYYYYQAVSGLPLFLHPLDIKILFSHFSSYASFPDTITIRVESFAEGTVNDDLRKRCKYLAHMPEGADVVFVEADLEGVVGAEGLRSFEAPLRMRKARRREKGKKDDRAKARAEDREREREFTAIASANGGATWGTYTAPRYSAADVEDGHVPEGLEPAPVPSGAWGARSFAATALAAARGGAPVRSRPVLTVEEEVDMDEAWVDLEQRSGAGRRKRSNKLVVLGGGGGRRR
ncbi:hypothetical protein FIBSPDRAFT_1041511 [Athelia psychrophila]|uniref:RING-type domain-containing protein n=1 Tax=Athelia psychrophila TaxID=1759441 RepID=A0A166NTL6_9AGAM|nr:hypothetical protein FIBSPDRAFT_1041511 [Fibularhizoctonia sp. CBS 109695]